MAEACWRLCPGDAQTITGRVDYAADVIEEFGQAPAQLI
jgi:hypothetical protein